MGHERANLLEINLGNGRAVIDLECSEDSCETSPNAIELVAAATAANVALEATRYMRRACRAETFKLTCSYDVGPGPGKRIQGIELTLTTDQEIPPGWRQALDTIIRRAALRNPLRLSPQLKVVVEQAPSEELGDEPAREVGVPA